MGLSVKRRGGWPLRPPAAGWCGVVAGNCYIYRVLHPGRATLCIRRQADGNWGVSELEASCNRKADPATREFVNA